MCGSGSDTWKIVRKPRSRPRHERAGQLDVPHGAFDEGDYEAGIATMEALLTGKRMGVPAPEQGG